MFTRVCALIIGRGRCESPSAAVAAIGWGGRRAGVVGSAVGIAADALEAEERSSAIGVPRAWPIRPALLGFDVTAARISGETDCDEGHRKRVPNHVRIVRP
jgi:hypothetical protein